MLEIPKDSPLPLIEKTYQDVYNTPLSEGLDVFDDYYDDMIDMEDSSDVLRFTHDVIRQVQ